MNEDDEIHFDIVREHCTHERGDDHEEHDPEYCCGCFHFHARGTECPRRGEPCGDYRCCVND